MIPRNLSSLAKGPQIPTKGNTKRLISKIRIIYRRSLRTQVQCPLTHSLTKLLSYIEHMIPSTILLQAALGAGPLSPGLKHSKRSKLVVQVCWAWYNAGTGFIYEDIFIRRIQ
ncbi:hypothetical protein CPB83DRAFT_856283 [Crepidotus variabilis]|uniref:Uncharacterized protein n=1 Tax=Crepidotus variabilis TaxID=179855 RepID=A0A9P6EE69_9AGAR|nr:hypothetical protein CPB83DRAFT_856283 [Crepidotus variabilis]